MKRFSVVIMILGTLTSFSAAYGGQSAPQQQTLLKNWTLSRCLAHLATDARTRDDANATAGAYLEQGRLPIEAYEKLDQLVLRYAGKTYSGSVASEFNTMKCIDLFQSSELNKLTYKLIRSR